MPTCRNCHSRIDKFNEDRCPICGVEKPFEGLNSDTIEITTSIDVDNQDYHPRQKKTLLLLFIFLGFFGVPYFYLYQKRNGLIYLLLNVIGISAITFILGFYASIPYYFSFLIALGIFMLLNSGLGLYYFFKNNLKDGRGEFII